MGGTVGDDYVDTAPLRINGLGDDGDEERVAGQPSTQLDRRKRVTLTVAVLCVLVAAAGLVASNFVRSPQEQAAAAGPPQPSVLTAPVVKRALERTVISRGTVTAARQIEVTTGSGGRKDGGAAVVTDVPLHPGAPVEPGTVLVEVSGRPVIALPGDTPAYRDLRPGDSGDDVTQLQQALAELGHYTGQPSGTVDARTKQGIAALYESLGYPAPTTGDYRARRQDARDAVTKAREAVADMRAQIAQAKTTSPSGGGGAAAGGGPGDDGAGDASSGGTSGGATDQSLTGQLRQLQQALTEAIERRNHVVATTGPMLPRAEAVFVPSFPARVATLSARVGDTPEEAMLTLSAGQLHITGQLPPEPAELLRQGATVTITSETVGDEVAGTVATLGEPTTEPADTTTGDKGDQASNGRARARAGGGGEQVAPHVPVTITPDQPLPDDWAGANVRLTFSSAATQQPVLVVPISAVSTGADGTTTVTVLHGQARTQLAVQPGATADGYVQVTPTDPAAIADGDLVVVGAP